jgi:hypothetical protein
MDQKAGVFFGGAFGLNEERSRSARYSVVFGKVLFGQFAPRDIVTSIIRWQIDAVPVICRNCHAANIEHGMLPDVLFIDAQNIRRRGGVLGIHLYRLGNIVGFALGRGPAFEPIREYGMLRTVGHMGHVREYTARAPTA